MISELGATLEVVFAGTLPEVPNVDRNLPPEILALRHVALSGDGEPTVCPNFAKTVEAIIHLRATGGLPFFKLVLLTNCSGLDRQEVISALENFTLNDEIWAKLDVGSQLQMDRINQSQIPLDQVMSNILFWGRRRPIVIQSLFPTINCRFISPAEIQEYAGRLKELKQSGAQISSVQIYSASRPTHHAECGHAPLRLLSEIAQTVRQTTGIPAEIF
jgi:wyosine [tRNA(Phe)-imidazoG37] synthetase (radical SAM superfamily)